MRKAIIVLGASLLLMFVGSLSAKEKLTPQELVAKHLQSIGSAEARLAVGNRLVGGTCRATFRLGGSGQIDGQVVLASERSKILIAMEFSALEYPYEKMAFDGFNVTVEQLKPGTRSHLAQFVYTHTVMFRQGLISGVLSSAWPFWDLTVNNPQLQYTGTKKIEDRVVHELRFRPRKPATDLTISLYFEDETFRHVRSQYRLVISAPMGNRPEDSSSQRETRYLLVEDFSDFSPEGQLTLPHTYKIQYSMEGQNRSILFDWAMQLTKFAFNQPLQPGDFVVGK